MAIKAVKPEELERAIVYSTVREKAIAHPVDSRVLEIARHKVTSAAKCAGVQREQTVARRGKELRRRAGGYAHAKQFLRPKKVVKRQRTTLGVVMREAQRKLAASAFVALNAKALSDLAMCLKRAERSRTQKTKDKNKLYAPEGDGGPLMWPRVSESQQASLDATCRELRRFCRVSPTSARSD